MACKSVVGCNQDMSSVPIENMSSAAMNLRNHGTKGTQAQHSAAQAHPVYTHFRKSYILDKIYKKIWLSKGKRRNTINSVKFSSMQSNETQKMLALSNMKRP